MATKIKSNGIVFNCEISGQEGAPWLVFSNSLMTDLSMWDDQEKSFAGRFRILRYDQRGHGQTEAPAGAYTLDTLAADVIGLFDALKIAQAHFVGLSMGGMTGIAIAEQYPDRLISLTACDCGPASTPQSAQQWADRIEIARAGGMEALVEPTVNRWCPPEFVSSNKKGADRLRKMIRATPLKGFIGCALALSNFDLRPKLAGIKLPVQFVCGTFDAALPGTKALHAGVPGSAMAEIEGAGHISNVEQPEAFTAILNKFLPK